MPNPGLACLLHGRLEVGHGDWDRQVEVGGRMIELMIVERKVRL